MNINAMELVFELRQLADKFSEGWHNGIKIDASDIMLLSQSASFIEAIAEAEKREWVGLTDEEIQTIVNMVAMGAYQTSDTFARAIEAKLKQKNGYAEEKNT